jgi:hypothetical protein
VELGDGVEGSYLGTEGYPTGVGLIKGAGIEGIERYPTRAELVIGVRVPYSGTKGYSAEVRLADGAGTSYSRADEYFTGAGLVREEEHSDVVALADRVGILYSVMTGNPIGEVLVEGAGTPYSRSEGYSTGAVIVGETP